MKGLFRIIVLFFVCAVVLGVVTLVVTNIYKPEQSPTEQISNTTTVTRTNIIVEWNESDPDTVVRVCKSGPAVLGCSFTQGGVCHVWVTAIPKAGRSPYQDVTGLSVVLATGVWGHEMAHCLGVDIHGDGNGR